MTLALPRPRAQRTAILSAARAAPRTAAGVLRRSPATLLLLAVLLGTSITLALTKADADEVILRHVSSNLHHIEQLRLGVLIVSAFWLENPAQFATWALLFLVVVAPAEAWLGTGRWLAVFAAGHIGATLATVGGIYLAIQAGVAGHHLAHSMDVGVSYGFFAVAGILAYRLPRRWRVPYVAALASYPLISIAIAGSTFTDYGHLAAIAIGCALYPLARGRGRIDDSRLPIAD